MNYRGASEAGHERRDQDVSDAVVEQAQAWVRRLMSGEATQDDALDLAVWRQADARHERAFVQAARLHRVARQAVSDLRGEQATRPTTVRRGLSRRMVMGGAIAASAAGVAIIAERSGTTRFVPAPADFTTAKGETRRVELAAGVSVEMNTLTRIALRPQSGVGAFELLAGEAVVAIDRPDAPLSIFAQDGETTASQARLAMRCLDGQVRVSCLEGAAQVRSAGQAAALPARHSVTYDQKQMQAPTAIDPEAEAAWRRGLLVFRDQRLGDVIEEINRYRTGRIVIADPRLRNRRVNGAFHTDRIDQVIDQMRLAYGVRATRLPGDVVLVA
jgi:transmembrane sensor